MTELESRVARCFAAVFPALTPDRILRARRDEIEHWDSVAAITLVSVLEEEFGSAIEIEALPELDSFQAVCRYIEERPGPPK